MKVFSSQSLPLTTVQVNEARKQKDELLSAVVAEQNRNDDR